MQMRTCAVSMAQVITSATFHPNQCNIMAYGSSRSLRCCLEWHLNRPNRPNHPNHTARPADAHTHARQTGARFFERAVIFSAAGKTLEQERVSRMWLWLATQREQEVLSRASRGSIRVADMRDSALCDQHSKGRPHLHSLDWHRRPFGVVSLRLTLRHVSLPLALPGPSAVCHHAISRLILILILVRRSSGRFVLLVFTCRMV